MSGFLYFLSGWNAPITDASVDQVGLRYAWDKPPAFGPLTPRTPSGQPGTIAADLARLGEYDLAYNGDPAVQTWRKRAGDDCVWVGYWNDAPPTPGDLALAKRPFGDTIELGDGNHWRIPRLLDYEEGIGFKVDLPCTADLDASGKWINGEVLPQYRPLAKLAERLYQGMVQAELGKAPRLTTDEMLTIAADLLACGYAVSPLELAMLRVLPIDKTLKRIAYAASNWDWFVECYEKKNAVSRLATSPT